MQHFKHLLHSLMAFAIATISLTSCSHDKDEPKLPSLTDEYVGEFSGRLTLNIAGQYDYDTDLRIIISEGENETLNIPFPEYELSNTLMGDITMGTLTLDNLAFDSSKGGFYLD